MRYDPKISEKNFQQQVVNAARTFGWKTYHTYSSQRSVPGFPDLVMVRGSDLIFSELKTMKGKVSTAQSEWLDSLSKVNAPPQVELWRPSDWDDILAILQK